MAVQREIQALLPSYTDEQIQSPPLGNRIEGLCPAAELSALTMLLKEDGEPPWIDTQLGPRRAHATLINNLPSYLIVEEPLDYPDPEALIAVPQPDGVLFTRPCEPHLLSERFSTLTSISATPTMHPTETLKTFVASIQTLFHERAIEPTPDTLNKLFSSRLRTAFP